MLKITQRRLWFFSWITLTGTLLNLFALQLPTLAPLLLGNISAVLLTWRLGPVWGLAALGLLMLPVTPPFYWLSSALQVLVLLMFQRQYLQSAGFRRPLILYSLLLVVSSVMVQGFNGLNQQLLTVALLVVQFYLTLHGAAMLLDLTANAAQRQRQSLQHQLSVRIAAYATMPFGILVLIAMKGAIVHDLAKQHSQLDGHFQQSITDINNTLSSYLATVDVTARNLPHVPIAVLLKDLVQSQPEFISALMTDTNGKVLHFYKQFVDAEILGKSVAFRPYFSQPKKTGQPYISDVFQGQQMGKDLLVAVSMPYLREQKFAGVLELSVSLQQLKLTAPALSPAHPYQLLLQDGSGKSIWSSDPLLPAGLTVDLTLLNLSNLQAYFTNSWFNPGPPLLLNQQASTLVLPQKITGTDWQLLLYADIRWLMWKYQLYLLIAMAAILLFMLVIRRSAAFFVRSYTDSLSSLINSMEQYQPEQLHSENQPVLPATAIELDRLSTSFIMMQRRIRFARQQLQTVLQEKTVLSTELELRVRHRTQELEQERDRATSLAATKTQFLANMSHELRTPLAIIRGFTAQLRKEPALKAHQAPLDSIDHHCGFLLNIVNDILDSAKMDDGKLKIASQQTLLADVLLDLELSMRSNIESKGLRFEVSADSLLPASIITDPLRLKQILLNLLGNAVKFTHEGFVRLALHFDSPVLSIAVIDSGIGISTSQQQHIFEAFTQADLSTTRKYGGSGLGLYICKKLTEQMGIAFHVSSQPGLGSRFELQLQVDEPGQLVEFCPVGHHASNADASQYQGLVLVVDDVPELRSLVCRMLEDHGVQTLTASDGAEAIQLLSRQQVDLVLLDMHMPVKDGLTTLRELKSSGFITPVLALTADTSLDKHLEMLAAGCQLVLTKPVAETLLCSMLADYLPAAAPIVTAPTATAPIRAAAADLASKTSPAGDEQARTAQVKAKLDDLQLSYLGSLPELIRQLHQAEQTEDLRQLSLLLHKTKGTAACFGLLELSQAAGQAEQQLKQQGQQPGLLLPLLQQCQLCLAELGSA